MIAPMPAPASARGGLTRRANDQTLRLLRLTPTGTIKQATIRFNPAAPLGSVQKSPLQHGEVIVVDRAGRGPSRPAGEIPAAAALGPPARLPVFEGVVLAGAVVVLRVAAIHQVAAAVGVVHDHTAVVVADHHGPVAPPRIR